MESFTSAERRVRPGKTVSPRPTKLKAWAYKEFRLGDLFTVIKGKRLTKADSIPGDINFVGSSASNHGITAKIANSTHLHPGGTITVTYNGSVGEVFYQTDRFWASDDVNVLYSKHPMIESVALYFCATIRKCGKKYGYAYKWTKDFMEKELLLLPITKTGKIDYAYMESRIREMEESRIREMDAYLIVSGYENCKLTEEETEALSMLSCKRFCLFSIDSLFDIYTGRDIIIGRMKHGDIPLISHQHDNNGISKCIKKIDNRRLFNYSTTLSLADRGIFYATTQIQNFHIGTRVKALTFKNGAHKEELRLFFVTSINKLQVLFTDYLVNATDKLPSLEISLPVTPSGEIDYHFMETYIRAIEKLTIQRVKDWRAKEISATNAIVNSDRPGKPSAPQYVPPQEERNVAMVAEDILIYGSLEVRLRNTKKCDLLAGTLDLVLMYAISPAAREKTEKAGRIALGIKEANLSEEAVKAYQSVRYIMFHYWKNSEAKPFVLTAPTRLVSRADVPEGFMLRQEKEAKQFLLIEYDLSAMSDIGAYDILKAQRRGSNRYLPFVCKVENIQE